MKKYQKPCLEISNLIKEDILLDASQFDTIIVDNIDWDNLFIV